MNQQCDFTFNSAGKRSRFFCATHNIECVEQPSPSEVEPAKREARCPISDELAGYDGGGPHY